MSRRSPVAKWVLPEVVDPDETICFQVRVPKDRQHIAAFRGAMENLAAGYKWQDDESHTAKRVAQVWRRIIDALKPCEKSTLIERGYEGDDMPMRIDCDCRVFVPCPEGGEQEIASAHDLDTAIRGLPKGDARQPTPGGGCETYHKNITGAEHVLIPVPVNTGDVITLTNWEGASNNHGNPDWYCGNGGQYFAGKCTGFSSIDGDAYMPSVPKGTLVVNVDGTYYDGRSPITVPGGVVNIQPFVVLNYDPADAISGTLTFDAQVCNNTEGEWSHTFDLTLSPGPFVARTGFDGGGAEGHWVAGVGWKPDTGAVVGLAIRVLDIICETHIDSLTGIETIGTYDCGGSIFGSEGYCAKVDGTSKQTITDCLPDGPFHESVSFASVSSDEVRVFGHTCVGGACPDGDETYTSIILHGTGVDPF